jgi:hypothetical protein
VPLRWPRASPSFSDFSFEYRNINESSLEVFSNRTNLRYPYELSSLTSRPEHNSTGSPANLSSNSADEVRGPPKNVSEEMLRQWEFSFQIDGKIKITILRNQIF